MCVRREGCSRYHSAWDRVIMTPWTQPPSFMLSRFRHSLRITMLRYKAHSLYLVTSQLLHSFHLTRCLLPIMPTTCVFNMETSGVVVADDCWKFGARSSHRVLIVVRSKSCSNSHMSIMSHSRQEVHSRHSTAAGIYVCGEYTYHTATCHGHHQHTRRPNSGAAFRRPRHLVPREDRSWHVNIDLALAQKEGIDIGQVRVDFRGSIETVIAELGAVYRTRTSEVKIPDLPTFPRATKVPLIFTVETRTKLMERGEPPEDETMSPAPPGHSADVALTLERTVKMVGESASFTSSNAYRVLGGLGDPASSKAVKRYISSPEWIPEPGHKKNHGVWKRVVRFESTISISETPSFQSEVEGKAFELQYTLHFLVEFLGIGNNLELEVPIVIHSAHEWVNSEAVLARRGQKSNGYDEIGLDGRLTPFDSSLTSSDPSPICAFQRFCFENIRNL
ncbi:hypothetical protein FB451DRAFT_1571089 [Mycena latifolia]|nr:hypothetical protein FB451DRAFT_1571089 [Mycena latifolia]